MKPTKRKGFNFLRSYFDVLNEIPKDSDKLEFLMAVINKQFLDEDPNGLGFVAKLSYESQRHSIEQSVKGYKDKMKTDVLGHPLQGPYKGGLQGGYKGPKQQEKEKEKEQQSYALMDFLNDWNETRKTITGQPSHLNRIGSHEQMEQFNELKNSYQRDDFINAMKGLFKQEKFPKGMSAMQSTPKHFLSHFELYLTAYHDKNKQLWGQ